MARRFRHGTTYGYNVRGCRCDPCTTANTAAARQYRAKRRKTYSPVHVDRALLADLLHELFPNGLTDDCPARQRQVA